MPDPRRPRRPADIPPIPLPQPPLLPPPANRPVHRCLPRDISPPPDPLPPEFRRRDDQQHSSSPPPSPALYTLPPPPYIPPGRRCRPRDISPPPHPMPSEFRSRNYQPERSSHPPPRYIPRGRRQLISSSTRMQAVDDDSDSKRSSPPSPRFLRLQLPREDREPSVLLVEEFRDSKTPQESSITNSSSMPQSPSRKEFLLDTRTLEESSITDVSPFSLPQSPSREDREPGVLLVKEFRDTKTLEESSITNSSSMPQSPSREDRETNVLKELPDTKTLDKSFITRFSDSLQQSLLSEVPDPLALKLHTALRSSSFVYSLVPTGLFIKYFVRMDKEGVFHTYPDRGGPFQTLQEAQDAIDLHHHRQRKMVIMDGLSDEERAVRNTLYWYHDGTRKQSAEAYDSVKTRKPTREMLKALLDGHNEDNDLLGSRALELEDIVRKNFCYDEKDGIYSSYCHFNLTMKTKGADANKDLYFAEVTCMSDDYEAYVLTCICVVKPDDNGECLVCEVEMKDMKHPTDDGYNHGRRPKFPVRLRSRRSRAYGVDLFKKLFGMRDEAWLIAEEARVRHMIKERMEARRSKLELDRGDGMIKEGKDARCSDSILKGDRVQLKVHTTLKEATMRSKLDLDLKMHTTLKEATMRSKLDLNADFWDELAHKDVDARVEARRKLEVDKRVDNNMIKKGKEAWHSKLEVDDHEKRDLT